MTCEVTLAKCASLARCARTLRNPACDHPQARGRLLGRVYLLAHELAVDGFAEGDVRDLLEVSL